MYLSIIYIPKAPDVFLWLLVNKMSALSCPALLLFYLYTYLSIYNLSIQLSIYISIYNLFSRGTPTCSCGSSSRCAHSAAPQCLFSIYISIYVSIIYLYSYPSIYLLLSIYPRHPDVFLWLLVKMRALGCPALPLFYLYTYLSI